MAIRENLVVDSRRSPLTLRSLTLSFSVLTLNLNRGERLMGGRTVLATIGGRGPAQRLQISLVHAEDGGLLIDLREQHHAEGIGWFDQRRLELDPRQFQQLQAVLGLKSVYSAAREVPATIPFPGPACEVSPRPAAGDPR
jgi:hypothetical protein